MQSARALRAMTALDEIGPDSGDRRFSHAIVAGSNYYNLFVWMPLQLCLQLVCDMNARVVHLVHPLWVLLAHPRPACVLLLPSQQWCTVCLVTRAEVQALWRALAAVLSHIPSTH